MSTENTPTTQNQPQQGRALPAVIKERKNALIAAMEESRPIIETLVLAQQEKFRQNMMDFAFQDYLMQIIQPRDIIEFAVKITRIGLDISPAAKECYIIPFDTKVQGVKVMLPQAIIPLNGIQQQAYQKGFQLMVYSVYDLDGDVVSEDGMPLKYLRQLNTANEQWVNDHFLGFEVVLTDLTPEKLPQQRKLVEIAYVREVTKTVQDKRFQIQSWVHKACRRAFRDFMIPSSRKVDVFDQVESLNDQVLGSNNADTDIRPNKNFEELQSGLAPLGITLNHSNGMAIASGNVHVNAKTLQSLGFKFAGNSYSVESTAPAIVAPKVNPNILNPEIETTLKSFGLEVNALDGYVKVTGNTDGLEKLLAEIGIKETKKGWVGIIANLKVPQ
jgi:hypothetical protein